MPLVAVDQSKLLLAEQNVAAADQIVQLTVQLHHKVQLRHEIRVAAIAMQHIVLCAAGMVNIPKRLAGQVFNVAIVVFVLQTNGNILF